MFYYRDCSTNWTQKRKENLPFQNFLHYAKKWIQLFRVSFEKPWTWKWTLTAFLKTFSIRKWNVRIEHNERQNLQIRKHLEQPTLLQETVRLSTTLCNRRWCMQHMISVCQARSQVKSAGVQSQANHEAPHSWVWFQIQRVLCRYVRVWGRIAWKFDNYDLITKQKSILLQ